jgi:ubiquinone/menaquinone biosynthesis C-methylase UbiE
MSEVDWDELAKSKTLQAVIDPLDFAGIKNMLIDRIQWDAISRSLEGNGSILDFGCGTGRFAQRLIDRGLKYYGIDSSSGMINSAKQLNTSDKVEFFYSNRLPLPFPDELFNVCLTVMVLQYLMPQRNEEGTDVFSELARVISPGGQLLIIEQASASGRSSSTVKACATEADYVEALSESFIVERVERIRFCKMTMLSSIYMRYGKSLILKNKAIKFLAKLETRQALTADISVLMGLDYYDICIKAVKKR